MINRIVAECKTHEKSELNSLVTYRIYHYKSWQQNCVTRTRRLLASDPLSVAMITSQVAADSCVDDAVVVQSTVQSVRHRTALGRNRYCVVAFARNNIRVNGKFYRRQSAERYTMLSTLPIGKNQRHSIKPGRDTRQFLLTSGLEHGPWRHTAANK